MANPGKTFEEEVKLSIPKKASGRFPWVYKPPDVPMFGERYRKGGPDPFRFAPKHPFDFAVSLPAEGTAKMASSVVPQIVFAFECKRCAGTYKRDTPDSLHALLPFKRVRKHQEQGLRHVAASGNVAGILWLVELDEAECYFLRIDLWDRFKESATGASMPLAYARAHGIEVERDIGRGTRRRYWRMAELFRHFGAGCDPTPERKAKRPKEDPLAKPVKLFDDLPPVAEELPFAAPQTKAEVRTATIDCPDCGKVHPLSECPPERLAKPSRAEAESRQSAIRDGLLPMPDVAADDHPFMAKGASADEWPDEDEKPKLSLLERLAARRKGTT